MTTIQTLYILQDRQKNISWCSIAAIPQTEGPPKKIILHISSWEGNWRTGRSWSAHKTLELGYMIASKQTSLWTQTTFKKVLVRLFPSDTRKVSPSSEIPQLIIAPHILPHHHQQQNQLPTCEVKEESNLHCATTATPKKGILLPVVMICLPKQH